MIQNDDATEDHRDIISRCAAGDERAYKELYELYADSLYNTGFRILNNRSEAEDAVQEAFVSAFRNISGFENRSSFSTWIKRILIHKCINQLNKKRPELIELKETQVENTIEEPGGDMEAVEWEVNKILKGIEALPANYRTVVSLYLLEGYDHEEIAQVMNVPAATIRTQYARGKKKLIDILKNEK